MTDVTSVEDEKPPHPIRLVVTDDLRRTRLTVFFRLILAIPLFVWAGLWGIAVVLAVVIAWFVALFTGRVPDGLHDFIAGWVRYGTQINAYLSLASDPYPWFSGSDGYPVDVEIAPATAQNRLTVLFRLILAIPAVIVLYILTLVARLVMILAWFYALFAGSLAKGLRDVLTYWLRYQAQSWSYLFLLTSRYPSFSDE